MPISGRYFDSVSPVRFDESRLSPEELCDCDLIGQSVAMQRLRMQIDRIGPHFRNVLVQGEIGTGKELVARTLLARSRYAASSFSHCHGAALAATVDDKQRGIADSPWQTLRAGLSGKVLLDSVDEMSLAAQGRLLEVLGNQTRGFESMKMVATAVTNLKNMVAAGRFRSDLYQRLATIEVFLEPLRRRPDDIPLLAHYLIDRYATLYDKGTIRIGEDAMDRLMQHDWSGNVCEMENVIRNGVLECGGGIIESQHLGPLVTLSEASCDTDTAEASKANVRLQDVVEQHVLCTLQACSGNKVRAAEKLGISRSTLYRILGSCSGSEMWRQI
jgi:DNA-binding NtrC family response regulator